MQSTVAAKSRRSRVFAERLLAVSYKRSDIQLVALSVAQPCQSEKEQVMKETEIGQNSIVHWSAEAVATDVNDEVVLMNLVRDRCYGLGSTGSDLWRRLREPIQVAELVTQLQTAYEAPPGQIESDVLQILRELAAEGLIEVSGGG
jgi:hypothetical protein